MTKKKCKKGKLAGVLDGLGALIDPNNSSRILLWVFILNLFFFS